MSAWLLGLALLAAPGPGDSVHPCTAATSSGTTFLPCAGYELEAQVRGKPPHEVEWTLPSGQVLVGQEVSLDTTLLGPGFHLIRIKAINAAGSDEALIPIEVQTLRWIDEPSWFVDPVDQAVVITAPVEGMNEVRWDLGDGFTERRWSYCPIPMRYRYDSPGPHLVTVEARNCHGDSIRRSFWVGGALEEPVIHRFEAACDSGVICEVAVGATVDFQLETTGTIDSYQYDWDGDGTYDEVSASPVTTHRFLAHGIYLSRVRVVRGPFVVERETFYPIAVLPEL